ncbi:hypothetical protein D9756_001230 [Leucocoprinus leucothites]|uniref:Large ribosomal subunit protein mL54 n=1 Tax=Leucocoprinus leucothites TaxID=201217 RepID=A0A8H5G4T7_9AGAR|nr:hypothetical protein D9756_001230 [Leucoagaricus leucothites]
MSFARILRQPPRCLVSVTRRYASSAPAATGSDSTAVKKPASDSTTPLSSCLEGTKLEGVNFLKGQAPVLAMGDDQYPSWLWTALEPKVYTDDGPGSKAERVKRRAENKQKIKDRNFMSTQ